MKVLYVSNYNDPSGWGVASQNNILALNSAGVEVVPRSITFNGSKGTKNEVIKGLEQQESTGCDVCIQHVLPPLYSYRGGFKNIGYCELETLDISYSGWPKYMNLMDEIWVANQASKTTCLNSGVKVPVHVVPHAIDMSEFENFENTAEIAELRDTFNFCFVGEFNKRKNTEALIKAYYLAFDKSDNVNLFLKLSGPTNDISRNIEMYKTLEHMIQKELSLGYYKPISVSFEYLERQHLLSIMNQCHIFVCPSYGESCCIPAMDAMALGKRLIWTSGIGIDDYGAGTAIPSKVVPCSYNDLFMKELYSGRDSWLEIDIFELMKEMSYRYQCWQGNYDGLKYTGEVYTFFKDRHGFLRTGQLMKDLLNGNN